jgi:hypothetical protein
MKYFIVLFLTILNFQSIACDCASIKSLKDADVAFMGKVIEVQRIEEPYRRYEITFQVSRWIKGTEKKKTIIVDTPCLLDMCCGINFQAGEVYQVYAYAEDKRVKTSLCWGTRKTK